MVYPKISSSTSRQPMKLKFSIQSYFNPTRRNINPKMESPDPHPPQKNNKKNRVKPKNSISTSRLPRKLKFGMQAYFDLIRRIWTKKMVTQPPSPPEKNSFKPKTSSSMQLKS